MLISGTQKYVVFKKCLLTPAYLKTVFGHLNPCLYSLQEIHREKLSNQAFFALASNWTRQVQGKRQCFIGAVWISNTCEVQCTTNSVLLFQTITCFLELHVTKPIFYFLDNSPNSPAMSFCASLMTWVWELEQRAVIFLPSPLSRWLNSSWMLNM